MAVKVYFETSGAAEAVAVFDDEETYNACYPALKKISEKEPLASDYRINRGRGRYERYF